MLYHNHKIKLLIPSILFLLLGIAFMVYPADSMIMLVRITGCFLILLGIMIFIPTLRDRAMLGFRFGENFNVPYISQSISEFWRRWHITLGGFMKEYLYIPLGGNRVSPGRTYFNLWVVFLISGLWHGASWNFVLWGVFHGTFLILDRLFMVGFLKKMGRLPAILLTFLVVMLGWVVFRAETVGDALHFYQALFAFRQGITAATAPQFLLFLLLAILFSFSPAFRLGDRCMGVLFAETHSKTATIVLFTISMLLFFISVGNLAVTDFNPFIYFRF